MIYPVIMAGGRGERFWPYSNEARPKQLLPLVSEKTMLEDILAHIEKLKTGTPVHIIANKILEKAMKKLLGKRKDIIIIGEPVGRNTAAAIALAAKLIMEKDPKGVMAVMTADHAISPTSQFVKAIKTAARLAEQTDTLVTFGIKPSRPDVGYGYVETQNKLKAVNGLDCYKVKRFHEKPELAQAKKYCKTGRFFWNSGMFAWRCDYLWSLFEDRLPDMFRAFNAEGSLNSNSRSFKNKLTKIYASIKGESIDFGIMEKAPDISLVVPQYDWDDIGSWSALDRLYKSDKSGNVAKGNAVSMETENTTIFSEEGLVATFGVKDLLVVQHNGVTLVVDKSKRADLKKLVSAVKKKKSLNKYL
ncbi:MAG: mannose-1-phosphate guanylyltransferase [Fibrobacteria bacterium]|nr:mannose-1-phosphate guanylyltransferase [Fibrobacteria bacterium]